MLTGVYGSMVKAHIIADAFMQRVTDAPFVESDGVIRPARKFTGWYDGEIVIRRGENLLEALDDVAARCLVQGGYTYRSRRDADDVAKLRKRFVAPGPYVAHGVDSTRMRLFGLSLLWRAAVSRLPAFELVRVAQQDLDQLRDRIIAGDPGPHTDYPVYFCLFDDGTELPKIAPFQPEGHPFVRFFLDGVLCYVAPTRTPAFEHDLGRMLCGSEPDRISMLCLPSESSEHLAYATKVAGEIWSGHGDVFAPYKHAATRRRQIEPGRGRRTNGASEGTT